MGDGFSWLEFLAVRDRQGFVDEFSRVIVAAADLDNYAPLGQLVGSGGRQPRSTPTPNWPGGSSARCRPPDNGLSARPGKGAQAQGTGRTATQAGRMGLPVRHQRRRLGLGEGRAAAPCNARTAWERITTEPRGRSERQHPLRGSLGTRLVNGETLEQWQYEVTGAGRLWYCIDDQRRIVWLIDATTGHPKATE